MNLPLNIDIQQVLLHMFNFVILFAALYFLLYKPVKKYIDDREQEYKNASERAKSSLKEAEDALASLDETIRERDDQAKQEREKLAASAQEQYNNRINEAEAEARRIIDDAREEAEAIRKKALRESSNDISQLALDSVKKAAMSNTDEAFEAFLAAIEKVGNDE